MPGFSRRNGAAVALATALTITLSPSFARPDPAQAAAGTGGPAGAAHRGGPASALPAATLAPATRIQPGGPLAGDRRAGSAAFGPTAGGLTSTNWAGYTAVGARHGFRFVKAVLFVPYIDCTTTPGTYSAHWVGLDGESTDTVEQAGVLAACHGTTPEYSAWYEMFPKAPVYPRLAVKPGDSVTASVYYRQSTGTFVLRIDDTSSGGRFSTSLPCPAGSACRRASAEIISEAPSSEGKLLPLTDFRALSFDGIRVTDATGDRSGLRARWWRYTPVTTISAHDGAIIDQPTELYRGDAFSNYWMRSS